MVLAIQGWKPDTCGCFLIIKYDESVGLKGDGTDTILSTFTTPDGRVVNSVICLQHAGKTLSNIYASALDHNRRKNNILTRLLTFGSLTLTDAAGNKALKDGIVTWSFSGVADAAVLTVSIPSLTALQKTAVQAFADTTHGIGKVVIV